MAATAANHGGRAVVPAASGAARTRWSQWDRKEREAGRVQAERSLVQCLAELLLSAPCENDDDHVHEQLGQ